MENDTVGKLILETGKTTRKAFDSYYLERCKDPLKPIAGRVFGYLAGHRNCSAQDIQNAFTLSKATVSECLSLLIERGYISYTKSEEDAREKVITVTEAGIARARSYANMVEAFEERLVEGFSEKELSALKTLLEKIKKRTEELVHE